MSDIIDRLRNTPNWQRESFDHWKSATCVYDRAPFDAADEIARLREQVAALTAERKPLTEQQIVACIVEAGCLGTVKMTYETGPYEITRTTINADRFARAIERAHSISAARKDQP